MLRWRKLIHELLGVTGKNTDHKQHTANNATRETFRAPFQNSQFFRRWRRTVTSMFCAHMVVLYHSRVCYMPLYKGDGL